MEQQVKKDVTIAIVDDKPANYLNLCEKLSAVSGINIAFTAINGEDFLEKMKRHKPEPQVVFMDIDMPVMNGIDTVATASELYPNVKFIMLTVFDDDEKIFDAIRAGAVGYLLKDEKTNRIITAIEEVMEYGGAPMSPRIARKSLQLLTEPPKNKSNAAQDQLLTQREIEILKAMVEGLDYRMIADRMFVSPHTVRTHINNIYKKLHVNNKTQAVKVALKKGWF